MSDNLDASLDANLDAFDATDRPIIRRTEVYPGVEQVEYADGGILWRGIGVPSGVNGTYRIGAVQQGLAPPTPGVVTDAPTPKLRIPLLMALLALCMVPAEDYRW